MESGQFPKLDEVVKQHVLAAIEMAGGSKAKAAELLGVSIKTVYNHVNRYNMEEGLGSSPESSSASVESQPAVSSPSVGETAGNTLPTGNGSSSIFG